MMENDKNKNGGIVNNFYGNIGHIYNGNVTYNAPVTFSGNNEKQQQQKKVSVAKLIESSEQVRQFFWGDSSWAVVFCVCRDYFEYADNMSKFERDFHCPEGLLSSTFRNNSYMRLHVDKWKENGAMERVLRLVDAYKTAVANVPER